MPTWQWVWLWRCHQGLIGYYFGTQDTMWHKSVRINSRMCNSFYLCINHLKGNLFSFKFWLIMIWSFDRTCRIFSAALWHHPLIWRDLPHRSFWHHLWWCPFWHQLGFGHRLFYSGVKMMVEGYELASWEEQEEECLRDSCSLRSSLSACSCSGSCSCASTWSFAWPSTSPSRTSPRSSSYQLLVLPKHPFVCPKILKLVSFGFTRLSFFKPGFSFSQPRGYFSDRWKNRRLKEQVLKRKLKKVKGWKGFKFST